MYRSHTHRFWELGRGHLGGGGCYYSAHHKGLNTYSEYFHQLQPYSFDSHTVLPLASEDPFFLPLHLLDLVPTPTLGWLLFLIQQITEVPGSSCPGPAHTQRQVCLWRVPTARGQQLSLRLFHGWSWDVHICDKTLPSKKNHEFKMTFQFKFNQGFYLALVLYSCISSFTFKILVLITRLYLYSLYEMILN